MEEGRITDDKDEQYRNAWASIRESFVPVSNVKIESASHHSKQLSQIISTDKGMQIDERHEDANVCASMRESLEPASNPTLEHSQDEEKRSLERTSADDGTNNEPSAPIDAEQVSSTPTTRPQTQIKFRGENKEPRS
jgi:hypothetical protein